MKFAAAHFGRIDVLVNNAGIQHVANVEDFPPERWDAIIAINLSSAFHTTRFAVPAMREANWGRVINIASAHGLVASAQKSAYVAAKHGIVGFTKSVALETATTGVTCNAICPGWVLTPLVQKQIDDRAAREGIPVAQAQKDLLAKSSLRCSSPPWTSWADSPCSCARRRPTRYAVWPGRSTAAGPLSRRCPGAYFSCTEPDTLTTTLVLPASTGTGASADDLGLHRHHARADRAALVRVDRHLAQRVAGEAEALGEFVGLLLEVVDRQAWPRSRPWRAARG